MTKAPCFSIPTFRSSDHFPQLCEISSTLQDKVSFVDCRKGTGRWRVEVALVWLNIAGWKRWQGGTSRAHISAQTSTLLNRHSQQIKNSISLSNRSSTRCLSSKYLKAFLSLSHMPEERRLHSKLASPALPLKPRLSPHSTRKRSSTTQAHSSSS